MQRNKQTHKKDTNALQKCTTQTQTNAPLSVVKVPLVHEVNRVRQSTREQKVPVVGEDPAPALAVAGIARRPDFVPATSGIPESLQRALSS
jgi:hypothetical protein